MSNGEQDCNYLNTKSSRQVETEKKSGHLVMLNLSGSAAKIKQWRLTNTFCLVQKNPKMIGKNESKSQRNEWLRSKISSMSDEHLAFLDKHKIKILGIDK